jgi:pantoate--beta-alanine ligase
VVLENSRAVRDADGRAMSSRNGYLSAAERTQAPQLQRELAALAAAVRAGARDFGALAASARGHLEDAGWRVDYVEVRDADTLAPPSADTARLVVLGAAWLGRTRLIDNLDFDLTAAARA